MEELDSGLRQAAWILFGKQKFYHRIYKLSSFFDSKGKESKAFVPYSEKVRDKTERIAILTERFCSIENPKFEYIDQSIGLTANFQQVALKIYHAKSYGVIT